jgi:O-acetyl-ADP-ribose deacetylase (regulator of RNase III)
MREESEVSRVVNFVIGDLFQAPESIIGHQVNCQAVMGSGVAKQVKQLYPEVFREYIRYCNQYKGNLLGSCQIVKLDNGTNRYVANLFGQQTFGRNGRKYTSDEALRNALSQLYEFAKANQCSIALPYKIGCDRGGGDWNVVLGMINDIFTDVDIKLYKLE